MNEATQSQNTAPVIKFAVKQILLATNAIAQRGDNWTLTLDANVIGIQPNVTFTSQAAAVDAVAQTLTTQFQKTTAAA